MQKAQITSVPLADVADKQRTVPADNPLIAAARAVGTCFGDKPVDFG
jgi:6-phosphofructokinase 1